MFVVLQNFILSIIDMEWFGIISSILGIIGGIITLIWRLSSFAKQIENKLDKELHNKTEEAIAKLEQRFDYLEKELKDKADITELTLLKQAMDYVKEQMVTKADWYQLKDEIIKAIKT